MGIRRVGALEAILSDKKVVSFRKKIAALKKLDRSIENIEAMKQMHTTRLERRARTAKIIENAQRDLIEMTMRNQALRSHIVELTMPMIEAKAFIEEYFQAICDHIIHFHADVLAMMVNSKAKSSHESAIRSLFPDEMKFKARLTVAIKVSDYLVKDIDQAAWAVKAVNEVLAITAGRSRKI